MTLFERFIEAALKRGTLTLVDARGKSRSFGTPTTGFPDVRVRMTDDRVARDAALAPDTGIGEAYMNGRLIVEQGDILDLIRLGGLNRPWESRQSFIDGASHKRLFREVMGRIERYNGQHRSKKNVAHHYDLGDRLYDLFLDTDRQYSCAYFTDGDRSLDDAQVDKKAHIAAKLLIRPGDRILDIGCGWGGLALSLAKVAPDVCVTGITLSEEQLKTARERAAAAGLADRVSFELIDYRKMSGQFDRIVSVGMFEHVGPPAYRAFFGTCARLLTEDGVMLLHTIGRMGGPGVTDKWTAKYIFPGGYSPALSEIVKAHEDSGLACTDIEVLRVHYSLTLKHWYDRTVAARDAIIALYDEKFYRMWQFYLAGACVAFDTGSLCNYQLQYARDRRAVPLTRDYMAGEVELRAAMA